MAEKSNVLVRQVPQWMTKSVKPEHPSVDDLEKRLGDLVRRHDRTRKLLVDALSLTVAVLASLYFKPEGAVASVCVVWGAMAVVSGLTGWFLKD